MSLINPATIRTGVVALARNPAAVLALKGVASKIWEHRHLFGEAAVAVKELFGSRPREKKRGRRIAVGIPSPISVQHVNQSLAGGYIARNTNFTRMISNPDGQGCMVIGSILANSAVRATGVNGTANNYVFGGQTGAMNESVSARNGFGVPLNPVLLVVNGAGTPVGGRLNVMEQVFGEFRFRHLHVKYVPRLTPVDERHGTLQLAYVIDPSTMGNFGSGSDGMPALASVLNNTTPSVTGPSWAPFDLELNFPNPEWCVTNPEGVNIFTTSDSLAANMRQCMQGMILAVWVDPRMNYADPTVTGYFTFEFAVEFRGPVWDLPDYSAVTLSRSEKSALSTLLASGWTPTEQLRTANATPLPATLHNRADQGAGAPNSQNAVQRSSVEQNIVKPCDDTGIRGTDGSTRRGPLHATGPSLCQCPSRLDHN